MSTEHPNHLERLAARLPGPLRAALAWVLRPAAKWLRIPLGIVLILCGFLGFLPILGFWMVPLGALLIAEDVPLVRRPTLRAINAIEGWWKRRRRSAE
jgi:purine-cytosine permease-like protein